MKLFKLLYHFYWRYIASPEKYARHIGVNIGDKCFISTREWSSEPYLINIGDNVQITRGVSFYTHGGGHAIRQRIPDFDSFGKVIVEDGVYIGAFSQIMAGVTIGRGSVIAAGSIITKSVAPFTVVGGNPAKFICTVEDFIAKNKKYNVHTYFKSEKEKKYFLLSLPDDNFIKK